MIYVGSGTNQLASGAALALTNQDASAVYRERPTARKGSGKISLSGAYTGAADALLEVEIVSATPSATPNPSRPKFTGVGSGSLIEAAFESGAPAEEITVTLIDKGTQTTRAFAPLEGVLIRAKAFGTSGNAITITINRSAITYTATQRSLTSELPARAVAQIGPRWDFGAVNLTPEGEIPPNAPRIAFARAGAVYRHYREFIGREYAYSITPANERAIPLGSRVYTVTGTYTVVISDGTTTRTYSSIITLYDLLAAIRADGSSLVDVVGTVVADRRPNGMGAIDLQTYTAPYIVSIERSGSKYVERSEPEITLSSVTPQEVLTLECVNASELHGEVWRCSATVSGQLDDVVTDELSVRGPYTITIPRAIPPAINPFDGIAAALEAKNDVKPVLCVDRPVKGPRARQKALTFVYSTRASGSDDPNAQPCECGPISDGPGGPILGEGAMAESPIPAAVASQLTDLLAWASDFVTAQVTISSSTAEVEVEQAIQTLTAKSGRKFVFQDLTASPRPDPINQDAFTEKESGQIWNLSRKVSAQLRADELDVKACNRVTKKFYDVLYGVYVANNNSFPSGFTAQWQSEVDDMQTEFAAISSLTDGAFWLTARNVIEEVGDFNSTNESGSTSNTPPTLTIPQIVSRFNVQKLTETVDVFVNRYDAILNRVRAVGLVAPRFDGADGSGVSGDQGTGPRFVSQDGYVDLFPGRRYVSAKLLPDESGTIRAVDTLEFTIGIGIACPENLRDGDKLTISIDGGATTYQPGDTITVSTVFAAPVGLGGGQFGNDQITWSVSGSVSGALPNYELRRVAYATDRGAVANQTAMLALSSAVVGDYCQRTDLGGAVFALITAGPSTLANWRQMTYTSSVVRFRITPAGREFALGDVFTFAGEGGTLRHRLNGGSWSSTVDIATQSIGSGLSIVTTPQQAPSWAVGDVYKFDLIAESGAENLRALSSSRARWTGASTLTITPSAAPKVIALAGLSYADGTTLSITGSNDNFSTSTAIGSAKVARGHAALVLSTATAFAKVRVALPASGSGAWAYVGNGVQMQLQNGNPERGTTALTNGAINRALGATIAHSACNSQAITDIRAALDTAHATDNGYIGAVVEVAPHEMAIGSAPESIQVADVLDFQAPDASRLLSFSLSIEGAAL